MKKIFSNGWVTLGFMLLTAIADLIAVPFGVGAGFIFAFVYMVALIIMIYKNWDLM